MSTYTLYVKPGCPYCQKVLDYGERNGIVFTLKNREDPTIRAELIARGGKRQVPYLVDETSQREMYESDDIIAYLGGPQTPTKSAPKVCPAF